jgi:hypothetical protein
MSPPPPTPATLEKLTHWCRLGVVCLISWNASISNSKGPGFEPRQPGVRDKDFRAGDSHVLRMRQYTEVQCVYAFRTSTTHYKDPAVPVRKSQNCGNIQKPECTEVLKRENGKWLDTPIVAALTSLISGHLLRTGKNIGQAPWAFSRNDMCAIKVLNQSINQSSQAGRKS